MKNTHNVLNMLLTYISKNDNINENEKIDLLVKSFFLKEDNKEIPNLYKLNITNISIIDSTIDSISIEIELVEAGLIVGKDGKTIKQLGGFISKNLNKKSRIYVKEYSEYVLENEK